MMLAFTAVASRGTCPLQSDLNAVIASAFNDTYLKIGKRIDGTMYSSISLWGLKSAADLIPQSPAGYWMLPVSLGAV